MLVWRPGLRRIERGLKERSLEVALQKYALGEVTLEWAAEIAGESVCEMAEVVRERKLSYNLDVDAVERALEE